MSKVLTHSTKSYIKIFFVGILVGCICRLADYFPADTLWSFSSIQTLLGFWIIIQLLMDVVGVIVFFLLFYKRAKSKKIFIVASVISSLIVYFVFPW